MNMFKKFVLYSASVGFGLALASFAVAMGLWAIDWVGTNHNVFWAFVVALPVCALWGAIAGVLAYFMYKWIEGF